MVEFDDEVEVVEEVVSDADEGENVDAGGLILCSLMERTGLFDAGTSSNSLDSPFSSFSLGPMARMVCKSCRIDLLLLLLLTNES